MKTFVLHFVAILAAGSASAATIGSWSASGGSDPGTDGWTQDLTGTGGWFQGDSAGNAGGSSGAGAGNPAWGFWSDSGGVSAGTWSLDGGALTVGQELGINFDNGWVDSNTVGVQFLSSSTVGLEVLFSSGGSGNYTVIDSTGSIDSSQGWTGDGFNISLAITASGTYDLSFLGYSGSGTLDNSVTSVDTIRVFSFDPTGAGSGGNYDIFANDITVVPEPSIALLGALGVLGLLRRRR